MSDEKPKLDFPMLKDLMTLARGGDPLAQAILQDIFEIESLVQKSYLPQAINQQKQVYLLACADFFGSDPNYGEEFRKPFESLSDWDSKAWQGYKGNLPKSYVDMLKKGTDLSGVLVPQGTPTQAEPKKRFWQRDKGKHGEVKE